PAGPVAPAGPVGPAGPAGPCGPGGPAGIWPARKSARSSEPFFTLIEVTLLLWSCAFPTLFLGSALTAAIPVPLSATSRAMQATIIAGDGLRRWPRMGILARLCIRSRGMRRRRQKGLGWRPYGIR